MWGPGIKLYTGMVLTSDSMLQHTHTQCRTLVNVKKCKRLVNVPLSAGVSSAMDFLGGAVAMEMMVRGSPICLFITGF